MKRLVSRTGNPVLFFLRSGTPLTQARIRMPEYRQRALILEDPGLLCFKKVALILSRSTVPYYYLYPISMEMIPHQLLL